MSGEPIYCTGGCDACRDYARDLGVPLFISVSSAPDERQAGLRGHYCLACHDTPCRYAVAQVPAQEQRLRAEGWEWRCASCHRPVAPMGMCETCGVFGIIRDDHEHYWVDAADDETGWHCTVCGVTEYPEPPFGAESVGVEGAGDG